MKPDRRVFPSVLLLSFFLFLFLVECESQVLKVGVIVNRATGPESLQLLKGLSLWKTNINSQGGIKIGSNLSRTVDFVVYDSYNDNILASSMTTLLVNSDKVEFLFLGPDLSPSQLQSVKNVASSLNKLAILSSREADDPSGFLFSVSSSLKNLPKELLSLVENKFKFTLPPNPTNTQQASMVIFLQSNLTNSNSFSVPNITSDKRITIIDWDSTLTNQQLLDKIGMAKTINPDIFVGVGDNKVFLPLMRQVGFDPKNLFLLDEVQLRVPGTQSSVQAGVPWDPNFLLSFTEWSEKFNYKPSSPNWLSSSQWLALYQSTYGEKPSDLAMIGSACGYLLSSSIEQSCSLCDSKPPQPLGGTSNQTIPYCNWCVRTEGVRAEFQGSRKVLFFGEVGFDSRGNNIQKRIHLTQINFRRLILVWPDQIKSSFYVYPNGGWWGTRTTIKIGASVSQTNGFAGPGQAFVLGYQFWADYINSVLGGIKIGVNRIPVDLIMYDDLSLDPAVSRLIDRLVTVDKVDFLLGPYGSALVTTAGFRSENQSKVMVQGGGAAETIFQNGFKSLFGVITPASGIAKSTIQLLYGKGARSVVIIYENNAFSSAIAEGSKTLAQTLGMTVMDYTLYLNSTVDYFTSYFQNLVDKNLIPDIFIGASSGSAASFLYIQGAKNANFNPKSMWMLGPTLGASFIDSIEEDGNYVLGPVEWDRSILYDSDPIFGNTARYVDLFETLTNLVVGTWNAQATAAGEVLQLGIEKSCQGCDATLSCQQCRSTASVTSSLHDLDILSFLGPIRFSPTGQNNAKLTSSLQAQNGPLRVVAPEIGYFTNVWYPTPTWKERYTITMGVVLSLTGKYSQFGNQMKQGYEYWANVINGKANVTGVPGFAKKITIGRGKYEIKLVVYDDASNASNVGALYEQLIQKDKVSFLLGPHPSMAKEACNMATKYNKLMMMGGMVEEEFSSGMISGKNVSSCFSITPSMSVGVKNLIALFATDQIKASSWLVLHSSQDPISISLVQVLRQSLNQSQGLVVQSFDSSSQVDPLVKSLKVKYQGNETNDSQIDILFILAGSMAEESEVLSSFKNNNFNIKGVFLLHSDDQSFFNQVTESSLILKQWTSDLPYADTIFGSAQQFSQNFSQVYNLQQQPTSEISAQSAATGLALSQLVEQTCLSCKGTSCWTCRSDANLMASLNQGTTLKTFFGPIQFKSSKFNAQSGIFPAQIQLSVPRFVYAAPIANSVVKYPLPNWAKKNSISLGAVLSMSGVAGSIGKEMKRGLDVWVDWLNVQKGGIKIGEERFQITLVVYDDQSNPNQTRAGVDELVSKNGVDFFVGGYGSSTIQSLADKVYQSGRILVTSSPLSDIFQSNPFPGSMFSMSPPISDFSSAPLLLLQQRQFKRVILYYKDMGLNSTDNIKPSFNSSENEIQARYTTLLVNGIRSKLKSQQFSVLQETSFVTIVQSDVTTAKNFGNFRPDAIIMVGTNSDHVAFIDLLKTSRAFFSMLWLIDTSAAFLQNQTNPDLLLSRVEGTAILQSLGDSSSCLTSTVEWNSGVVLSGNITNGTFSNVLFTQSYKQRYGSDATSSAAKAASFGYVLQSGLENSCDKCQGLACFTCRSVSSVQLAMGNVAMMTPFGMVQFDSLGRNVAGANYLVQSDGKQIKVINFPSQIAACPEPPKEQSLFGKSWVIGFSVITAILIICLFISTALIIKYRKTFVIKAASPIFCHMISLGCLMSYISVLVVQLVGYDGIDSSKYTDACVAFTWLLVISYFLVFSSLFAKTWRIYRIFGNSGLNVMVLKNSQLLGYVGFFVGIAAVILIIWTAVSKPTAETQDLLGDSGKVYYNCKSPLVFIILIYAYGTLVMLVGVYVTFKVRNVEMSYNESRYIGFAMYNLAIVIVIFVPLSNSVTFNPEVVFLLKAIGILFVATFTWIAIFVPKLWICIFRPEQNTRTERNSTLSVTKRIPGNSSSGTQQSN